MKTYRIISILGAAAMLLMSCDKFLDVEPDNRATVDTESKVISLLTSAYPSNGYVYFNEIMSDNFDEFLDSNPYTSIFIEQVWYWKDVEQSNNESPERCWSSAYSAITSANQALESIEKIVEESGWTTALKQAQAEAYLCRAYNHFALVNEFALNYNSSTSATDPGITYMTEAEHTLNPSYERNTVAECYELIEKDLQAALPNVGDANYTVPKYHFNEKAAYAFAARFYQFYEKPDSTIKYATLCLGSAPKTMLRDWSEPSSDFDVVSNKYIDMSQKCNLLLFTAYSVIGVHFCGPYLSYKKYAFGQNVGGNEVFTTTQAWGSAPLQSWISYPRTYNGSTYNFYGLFRLPYLFEMTDPVAQTGFSHTVYPAFTADESLLNRAEAYILKKDYDSALKDINLWLHNINKTTTDVTLDMVKRYYNGLAYSTWNAPTPKKHLNPAFDIDTEGSDQECMLQFILHMKRIENMFLGLRWLDVKRYGIEIWRRQMNADGEPSIQKDVLTVNDPRRAIQIPAKVIDAGYEPNPRNK